MADIRGRTVQDPRPGTGKALSIRRFRRSLGYAWSGLKYVFAEHPNLRLEALLFLLCLVLAFLLQVSPMLILLSWGLVMSIEIINTAVELVVDLVSPQYSELAGRAKDVSAGAVLVAAVSTAIVNAVLLLPPILDRLGLVTS